MATNNIQLPFQTSHAFIIGIDDYQHVSPLSTAVNDAEQIATVLARDHGYQVHQPLINATRAQVIHLLEKELARSVKAEDRVLFYFAGHGIALDSDDNPKGYLVPADAQPGDSQTLVAMEDLHRALTQLPCQHGMLILDCCFAGAFKWATGFRDVVFDLPGIIYEERFYQYAQDPAWQVITSSASDQKAVDVLSNRSLGMRSAVQGEHSPFALALLDGLAGEADTIPKGRGDGVITATELYTYLRDRVEDETMGQGKRQSPAMFSLHKHDKGQYIFLHPRHPLNLPPIPQRNPFMGLQSYNETDAPLFYGRDRVITALEDLAQTQPLVVVNGASGTGKSSVIKAGLLPRLRERGWDILPVVRPGKEPMESLQAVLSSFGGGAGGIAGGPLVLPLNPPPKGENTSMGGKPFVLVIDQYEELITQCLHAEDRQAFEQQLANWLRLYPQLRIIISIRSDFEPQFEEGPLANWWLKGRYTVPVFSQDELREVIIKPTVQEVLFFEPDSLVDRLVDAVNQAPGALPLLSFTLSELYHSYINSGRTNRAFTLEDYDKLGGVIGALRTRANAIYDGYDEVHQDSMRKLMLRMVSLEGGELASRRVLQRDLQFSKAKETQRIQAVADQMVAARLVSTGRDIQGQTYYEPAHDALVRAWARLWEWIKALGEGQLSLLYKLNLAVTDYQAQEKLGNSKAYLWDDDPRLSLLYTDLTHSKHFFNIREIGFLQASMDLRTRGRQIRRTLIASTIIILIGISGVALWLRSVANQSAQEASRNEQKAIETADSLSMVQASLQATLVREREARQKKLEADYDKLITEANAALQIPDFVEAEVATKAALNLDSLRSEAHLLLETIRTKTDAKASFDQLIGTADDLIKQGPTYLKEAMQYYERARGLDIDPLLVEEKISSLQINARRDLEDRIADANAFYQAGGDMGLRYALKNYTLASALLEVLPDESASRKIFILEREQTCKELLGQSDN